MKPAFRVAAIAVATLAAPVAAQTAPAIGEAPVVATSPASEPRPASPSDTSAVAAPGGCELHVWPTRNYIGVNTGLLITFGPLGALADVEAHKGHVKTVKDLMAEYLTAEAQVAELNRIGFADLLKLPGYHIVVEDMLPTPEDYKSDPALKAKFADIEARLKAKRRITSSQSPCYAELITTHIYYLKAMMYGSNLLTGWAFRNFGDKPTAIKIAQGQVKNPLETFPPKTPEAVETARLELRDAYAKDFVEYVRKKVSP